MKTEEVWMPVQGYDGRYEISNFGRIRTLNKIMKLHHMPNGYENISLFKDGKYKCSREHCKKLGERGSKEQKIYVESIKRPVKSVCLFDGMVQEHESVNQAARDTGCDLGNVSKVLKGEYKQTKGFSFEYIKLEVKI